MLSIVVLLIKFLEMKLLLVSCLLLCIAVAITLAKSSSENRKSNGKNRCDPNYKYRMADGSCNHLNNPLLGASETPFARLHGPKSANYADGISFYVNIYTFTQFKL